MGAAFDHAQRAVRQSLLHPVDSFSRDHSILMGYAKGRVRIEKLEHMYFSFDQQEVFFTFVPQKTCTGSVTSL